MAAPDQSKEKALEVIRRFDLAPAISTNHNQRELANKSL